jgi:hypothetical protein
MGTRSTTKVYDYAGTLTPALRRKLKPLLSLYRQMDGHPSTHGKDLAEFLDGMKVVNGFGGGTPKKAANGAGCLAAQLVCHLKDGIGGIYVTTPDDFEEYDYKIFVNTDDNHSEFGRISVEVKQGKETLFFGLVPEFVDFCNNAD